MNRITELFTATVCVPAGIAIAKGLALIASMCMVLCGGIVLAADRPKVESYFWDRTTAAATAETPTPLATFRALIEEDSTDCDDAEFDVSLEPQAETVIPPKGAPVKMRPVYRPDLMSVLRNSFEFYDDVPEGMGDEPPRDFQRIKFDGYTMKSCAICPAVKAMFDNDPRFDVNWIEGPYPQPLYDDDGKPIGVPILVDPVSNFFYWTPHFTSPDDLLGYVSNRRAQMGLMSRMPVLEDFEVGTTTMDAAKALLSVNRTDTEFVLSGLFDGNQFTAKAYTFGIPANLQVVGKKQRDLTFFTFPAQKPTLKVQQLVSLRWNIYAFDVDAQITRIKAHLLRGWHTLSWKVRDR